MTAEEIADRLTRRPDLPINALRVKKLYALCSRMGVDPADVLALLSDDVREQVTSL